MEATTFKLKKPHITGGGRPISLAKTDHMTVGLNYYIPGRKNKLHTHAGEDHIFVVMDGQAIFYNKEHQPTVLNKGEGIMLPENHYYYFASTGDVPLALFRVNAKKGNKPKVVRVDAEGNKRLDEEIDFIVIDGEVVEGQFWEMKYSLMKITEFQTLRLRAPIPAEGQVFSRSGVRSTRSTTLLRVETDEGISGIGSASGNGELIELIVARVIKPLILGMDPTDIEAIWDKI